MAQCDIEFCFAFNNPSNKLEFLKPFNGCTKDFFANFMKKITTDDIIIQKDNIVSTTTVEIKKASPKKKSYNFRKSDIKSEDAPIASAPEAAIASTPEAAIASTPEAAQVTPIMKDPHISKDAPLMEISGMVGTDMLGLPKYNNALKMVLPILNSILMRQNIEDRDEIREFIANNENAIFVSKKCSYCKSDCGMIATQDIIEISFDYYKSRDFTELCTKENVKYQISKYYSDTNKTKKIITIIGHLENLKRFKQIILSENMKYLNTNHNVAKIYNIPRKLKSSYKGDDGFHIFMDYSNTRGCKFRKYLLPIVRLIDNIIGNRNRKCSTCKIYGSNINGNIVALSLSNGYEIISDQRYFNYPEAFVDEKMHIAMFETFEKYRDYKRQTLILVTGDGNKNSSGGNFNENNTSFPKCINTALDYGWNVELISRKIAISAIYIEYSKKYKDRFIIKYVEELI
jgi:hypothetical protein